MFGAVPKHKILIRTDISVGELHVLSAASLGGTATLNSPPIGANHPMYYVLATGAILAVGPLVIIPGPRAMDPYLREYGLI
jgi:hypothetical protein